MRTLGFLAIPLACLAAFAVFGHPISVQAAPGRVALVIANAAYPDSDAELPTPINDALALSESLTRRGFAVEVARNLTKDGFQSAADGFLRRIEAGSVAMIFYSGYAIQAGRKNYFIPVDARIWSEPDVLQEGFGVEGLLADIAKRGAATRVVVVDASRRNPFERRYRSFSTGLAPSPALPGSLVLYSAAAGSVINETSATRGLFVTELVKQIGVPAISAEQAFGATRDALSKATRSQQVPALVSSLDESFSFDPSYVQPSSPKAAKPPVADEPITQAPVAAADPRPKPADAPTDPVPPVVVEPKAEPPADQGAAGAKPSYSGQMAAKDADAPVATEAQSLRDFEDAKAIGTKQAYQDYLVRHPEGALAAQARAELARIEAVESAKPKLSEAEPPAEPAPSYTPVERARKAALDRRIEKNPRDEQAYYERGQFHAQRRETALAIADFDQSIRMNPANPEAYNNRCWTKAVAGALDRALADCDQALKLRPNYVDALDSRGFVNLKTGRFRAAVADYDAALRIDPSHSSSLYGRGIAKRRLGQTGPAEKDLAGALQLNGGVGEEFAGYGLR